MLDPLPGLLAPGWVQRCGGREEQDAEVALGPAVWVWVWWGGGRGW